MAPVLEKHEDVRQQHGVVLGNALLFNVWPMAQSQINAGQIVQEAIAIYKRVKEQIQQRVRAAGRLSLCQLEIYYELADAIRGSRVGARAWKALERLPVARHLPAELLGQLSGELLEEPGALVLDPQGAQERLQLLLRRLEERAGLRVPLEKLLVYRRHLLGGCLAQEKRGGEDAPRRGAPPPGKAPVAVVLAPLSHYLG